MSNTSIPKETPDSPAVAYGRVLDLALAVRGIQIAAESVTHPLHKNGGLPKDAVTLLGEAHVALLEAQRVIGDHLCHRSR
jgi:hypothetical protein